MNRFYGIVGYEETVETSPGTWEAQYKELFYFGEILNRRYHYQTAPQQINDDLVLNDEISIVADPYAIGHFSNIRYVEVYGTKWKVTNVSLQYPRLILSLGGVFNA